VHFPIGVKRGQRFDLAVRQVTNRGRQIKTELPRAQRISLAEAAKLIEGAGIKAAASTRAVKRSKTDVPHGVFQLGANRTLITDLTVLDADGDDAILIEQPEPQRVEQARREAGRWRETIGAFQLGIPVSDKAGMLNHYLRLLSVLSWRAEFLRPSSRWYTTFVRYVELIAEKVRALGGDPWKVPATPGGIFPLGDGDAPPKIDAGAAGPADDAGSPYFEPGDDDWLGDTGGLAAPDAARPGVYSGKVSGLLHDHFGDFEGFTLEDYAGSQRRFFSREHAIREIAHRALAERSGVTVVTVSMQSRRLRRLLLRGPVG
jgi:hypothetical protein